MNFTLHQLQVFLKIRQTQSITKAAEEMFLTQPAVSIQLKNFQDQFEIPLTEVIGRKLYITAFGEEIALACEKILDEVYAINYKTLSHKGLLSGQLKISVVSTGKYIIPYLLNEFIGQHEGIDLQLDVTNKMRVIDDLEKNKVDFALVSILPKQLSLQGLSIMPNRLFLVGGTSNYPKSFEKLEDLFQQIPLIFREKGSGTRQTQENFIMDKGLSVRKKLELTSNEAVKQAVLAGLGCSIMPIVGLKNEILNNQIKIIPTTGLPLITTWTLVWLKNKTLSPAAAAFVAYLENQKEALIEKYFGWQHSFS